MRRAFLATLTILAAAAPARSDFVIRAPYVTVRVGHPTAVQVTLPLPSARPQPAPAPPVQVEPPPGVPLEIAPPAPTVPLPGTPAPSLGHPPTLREFAATFHPAGGNYQVTLLHPVTGKPVTVSFALPPGAPKVKVHRQQIAFRYRRQSVVVRFQANGSVRVRY